MQDLDNTTFDRIVGQGLPVLVRIDKEYPYGDTDDAWKEVGVVRPTPRFFDYDKNKTDVSEMVRV